MSLALKSVCLTPGREPGAWREQEELSECLNFTKTSASRKGARAPASFRAPAISRDRHCAMALVRSPQFASQLRAA
jgi:hypothetical protein